MGRLASGVHHKVLGYRSAILNNVLCLPRLTMKIMEYDLELVHECCIPHALQFITQ